MKAVAAIEESRLLCLPPELRNGISREVLISTDTIDLGSCSFMVQKQLLNVCTQTRSEGEKIFYEENSFLFTQRVTLGGPKQRRNKASEALRFVGKRNVSTIQSLTVKATGIEDLLGEVLRRDARRIIGGEIMYEEGRNLATELHNTGIRRESVQVDRTCGSGCRLVREVHGTWCNLFESSLERLSLTPVVKGSGQM